MSAGAIRAFGILTFVFEGLVALAVVRICELDNSVANRAVIGVAAFFFAITVIGIGLLLLRKWAALVFALSLAGLPIWLTLTLIGEGEFVWYAMIFVLAVVLLAPIVIVIRSWPLLWWRGKYFF